MAITDANNESARRFRLPLPARARAWLASEHAAVHRFAGTAFLIRVASAAVVFLSQILLARWMGSFEFGTYVYVWTWVLLIGDIVHLGVPLTAQRLIPEYLERKSYDDLRGYLIGSRWLTFAAATAAALIGALLVHLLQGSLASNAVMPLYLACACLPFYALSFMLDGIARSYNWIALGLTPHSLLRLGRPFEQVESQLTKTYHGSGLGLAIARSLTNLHGGSMKLRSKLDSGTVVCVSLPRDASKAKARMSVAA